MVATKRIGQIGHGRLHAGMAEGTSVRIQGGLMVMKQASQESEKQNCNDRNSFDAGPVAGARLWMVESHRVLANVQ